MKMHDLFEERSIDNNNKKTNRVISYSFGEKGKHGHERRRIGRKTKQQQSGLTFPQSKHSRLHSFVCVCVRACVRKIERKRKKERESTNLQPVCVYLLYCRSFVRPFLPSLFEGFSVSLSSFVCGRSLRRL
jgi:hypothetical protein